MPGLDGTGPMGWGPRTGRGLGYCPPGAGPAPYAYGVRGLGRGGLPWGGGRGFGMGRGRGWGRGFGAYGAGQGGVAPAYAPYGYGPAGGPQSPTREEELTGLRNEAEAVRQHLAAVDQRIADLERGGQDED